MDTSPEYIKQCEKAEEVQTNQMSCIMVGTVPSGGL